MAPKSQTRRQRGGGFLNLFSSKKNNTAKTFGEKYAPARGLASYTAQKRIIAGNVKKLQEQLGQTNSLINAAKTKNAVYDKLDGEYKAAVADQQTKWNAYTAAKAKVYSLLMQRQAASKGILDRARGVVKHGLLGLFSRKSYQQNVEANAKAAAEKKAALLARSKIVTEEIRKEKEKRDAFEAAIKKQNEEADRILQSAETAVKKAATAAPAAVAAAASGTRNPINNFNNNSANKPANRSRNSFNNNATRRNQLNKLLPSNRSNNSKLFTKFSVKNLQDYLRLNPDKSTNLFKAAKKELGQKELSALFN